jgi:hypothetical protein
MLNRWQAGRLHSWSGPFLCAQSAAHRAGTGAANAVDVPLGAFPRAPFASVPLMGRLPGISAEVPGFTEDLVDWDPPELPWSPDLPRSFGNLALNPVPLAPPATTAPGHAAGLAASGPERAVRPGPSLRLCGCLRSWRSPSCVTGGPPCLCGLAWPAGEQDRVDALRGP